jgi:hypothetical protein
MAKVIEENRAAPRGVSRLSWRCTASSNTISNSGRQMRGLRKPSYAAGAAHPRS